MIGVQSLVRAAPVLVKNVAPKRAFNIASSVVSGPARVKVSKTEVFVLGTLMSLSYFIVPGWILCNLKYYKE